MICSSECCVIFPVLGRIRLLGTGLMASTGVAVSTTRSLEQFCLSLGLVTLDLAMLCGNRSPLFRNSACRSILRAQLQQQSPGEMSCRDVSVAAPGALVPVGGEAAVLAGLRVFTADCAATARQLPGPWEASGLWFLPGNSHWTVSNTL